MISVKCRGRSPSVCFCSVLCGRRRNPVSYLQIGWLGFSLSCCWLFVVLVLVLCLCCLGVACLNSSWNNVTFIRGQSRTNGGCTLFLTDALCLVCVCCCSRSYVIFTQSRNNTSIESWKYVFLLKYEKVKCRTSCFLMNIITLHYNWKIIHRYSIRSGLIVSGWN